MRSILHAPRAVLAFGALACFAAGAAAQTAGDSPARFFLQEQQRAAEPASRPRVKHEAPRFADPPSPRAAMGRPSTERMSAPRLGGARAAAERRAAAPTARPVSPGASVAVFGDRFGQALAAGLIEDSGSGIEVVTFVDQESGLTRPDFDAWLASLRAQLAAAGRPTAAVMMLGANDRRALNDGSGLPEGRGVVEPDTPRWAELYGKRVEAAAAVFRAAGVPLIWVGLPSVRGPEVSAAFVRLNGLIRDHVGRAGARFVDTWEAFSDEAGRYSPVGPNVEGQIVTLRKADGLGFTRAGTRKLASFVEGDIKRLHGSGDSASSGGGPDGGRAGFTIERSRDFDQALAVDIDAQIRREAGLAPGDPSVRPAPVPAPVAGPVLPLTAPPLAPDGRLVATGPPPVPAGPAPPTASPAGRADDFTWPRP